MEATIEVTGLCKRFGQTVALDQLSFTVAPGQVTGFVGPNGAGKSTTMRVILGLDTADSGSALVGGRPYQSLRHPLSHLGALLDAAAVQPSRTARDHLLWMAHSQRLSPPPAGDGVTLRTAARPQATDVLARAGALVAVTGADTMTISGLAAQQIVALLNQADVPFAEVSAHRASLEEAYMELTRDAAEFRAVPV